jgi:hypothetical protein
VGQSQLGNKLGGTMKKLTHPATGNAPRSPGLRHQAAATLVSAYDRLRHAIQRERSWEETRAHFEDDPEGRRLQVR